MTSAADRPALELILDAKDLEELIALLSEAYAAWDIPCECGQDSDGCWRCEAEKLLASILGEPGVDPARPTPT